MAGKYKNNWGEGIEADYVRSQNITKTGRPKTTRKAKKVVKKVLKKVPGPIGTVARLSDVPRKLSNAAKNAKNLKKYPKTGLASKKEMSAFKKVMDAKSPALKKVFEANKRAAAHKKTRKQSMAKKSIALASTKRRKK